MYLGLFGGLHFPTIAHYAGIRDFGGPFSGPEVPNLQCSRWGFRRYPPKSGPGNLAVLDTPEIPHFDHFWGSEIHRFWVILGVSDPVSRNDPF